MRLERIIAVRTKKTIYRDGGNCIKVFNEDYTKAEVLSEALNQARVEETGLHVPRLKEVCTIDGKWAIVSEFIPGKTLDRLMAENPDKREAYLAQFVDLQLRMHEKRCPQLAKFADELDQGIAAAELEATARYALRARLAAMAKHKMLCHGDFNPSNIIIAEEGTPYILDWSRAAQGNGAADAARTCLFFRLNGDAAGEEGFLALFSEKSGVARQDVESWIPIVAASQSVRGNERERKLLLDWINLCVRRDVR